MRYSVSASILDVGFNSDVLDGNRAIRLPGPGWSQPTTTVLLQSCQLVPYRCQLRSSGLRPEQQHQFRLSCPRMLILLSPVQLHLHQLSDAVLRHLRGIGMAGVSPKLQPPQPTTTTTAAAGPTPSSGPPLSGFTRLLAWCVTTHAASTNARTSATIAIRSQSQITLSRS